MNMPTRFASLAALCGAALFAAGCGDSVSPESKGPGAPQFWIGGEPPGNLMVTTSTSGSDFDPDGYTVTVDGGPFQHIETNGSVLFPGLSAASHSIALTDLASNCSVTGDNPRDVTVPPAATITTIFDVACGAPPSLVFSHQPNDAATAPLCERVPPLLGVTPGSEIVTEVTVQDDPGNTVKTVTLTIATNGGDGTLCNGPMTPVTSLTAPVVNGIAHFSFDIDQPASTAGLYTLLATTTTPGVAAVESTPFCVFVPALGSCVV